MTVFSIVCHSTAVDAQCIGLCTCMVHYKVRSTMLCIVQYVDVCIPYGCVQYMNLMPIDVQCILM